MTTVNNEDPIEVLVHRSFHLIAKKLDVDVDLVAQIIEDYLELAENITLEERRDAIQGFLKKMCRDGGLLPDCDASCKSTACFFWESRGLLRIAPSKEIGDENVKADK